MKPSDECTSDSLILIPLPHQRYSSTNYLFRDNLRHFALFILLMTHLCAANSSPTTSSGLQPPQQQQRTEEEAAATNIRIRALHTLRRSLETYGDLTAKRLMLHMAGQNELDKDQKTTSSSGTSSHDSEEHERVSEREQSTNASMTPEEGSSSDGNATSSFEMENGAILRVRVGLKETHWEKGSEGVDPGPDEHQQQQHPSSSSSEVDHPAEQVVEQEGEEGSNRRQRSAALNSGRRQQQENSLWSAHHAHHQRRRRKGCPPLHGKDQLLCPSRNSHRYDVCVTREQLCNHVRDCPDGEDEDPKHCFFYKPLDDQLKTLSHAVLLLVDSVMSEHQQQTRNEL